jgi:hypothetical protein
MAKSCISDPNEQQVRIILCGFTEGLLALNIGAFAVEDMLKTTPQNSNNVIRINFISKINNVQMYKKIGFLIIL